MTFINAKSKSLLNSRNTAQAINLKFIKFNSSLGNKLKANVKGLEKAVFTIFFSICFIIAYRNVLN